MNNNIKVKCIKTEGLAMQFPLTLNKIYDAQPVYIKGTQKVSGVWIIEDNGNKDFYSIDKFKII